MEDELLFPFNFSTLLCILLYLGRIVLLTLNLRASSFGELTSDLM